MKLFFKILIGIVFLGLLCLSAAYYIVLYPNTNVKDDGIIYISSNEDFNQVVLKLENRNYLKNISSFKIVAKLKKYDELVKSGRYRIKDGMSNNDVVNMLRLGAQEPINLTFNNVRNVYDLASAISKQTEIDSMDIINLANDVAFIDSLGFTQQTIPALFIPDTYSIKWNTNARALFLRFKREYDKFWEKRKLSVESLNLTPIQITTIASIVEEESSKLDEYPVIAGVYINRINLGMKLEADPTLKFIAGNFGIKRLLDIHKQIDSPYNTYMYPGIPPGPIRIASPQVIDAVLHYTKHNYLFFCAKTDNSGYHNFSKTLRMHLKYADEYHKWLNDYRIFK